MRVSYFLALAATVSRASDSDSTAMEIEPYPSRNECALYAQRPGEVVEETFCNDSGLCQNLFDDDMVAISCVQAYIHIHEYVELVPGGPDDDPHPMPLIRIATKATLLRASLDDESFASSQANRRRKHRQMMWESNADSDAKTASEDDSLERGYPVNLLKRATDLEVAIGAVVDSIMSSFPRVIYDSVSDESALRNIVSLAARLGDEFKKQRGFEANSRFRNSTNMRKYMWLVGVMMQYMIRLDPRDPFTRAYVSAAAPYIHAFMYIQARMDVDYPGLYHGYQNVLTTLSRVDPQYLGPRAKWFFRLSEEELNSWSLPEIPLFVPDWDVLLVDVQAFAYLPEAGLSFEKQEHEFSINLERFLEEIDELFTNPDSDVTPADDKVSEELVVKAALLFIAARDLSYHVNELCNEYPEAVAYIMSSILIAKQSIAVQANTAIIDRCGDAVNMMLRFEQIEAFASNRLRNEHIHLLIPAEPSEFRTPLNVLLDELAYLDIYHMNIDILVSIFGDDLHDSRVPGGIDQWLSDTLDAIFVTHFTRNEQGECVYYRPRYSETLQDLTRLRSIGRFIAIYLRHGNKGDRLARYVATCASILSEDNSIHSVMFLNSEGIKRGFYDIFLDGELERALVDHGSEITEFLRFVSNLEDDNFFTLGFGSINTM